MEIKMNERIRELAGQALDRVVPYTWTRLDYDEIQRLQEYFAELIVRECATIINDIPSSPQGSWSDGYYEGCRDSAKQIQQHFGVEL